MTDAPSNDGVHDGGDAARVSVVQVGPGISRNRLAPAVLISTGIT